MSEAEVLSIEKFYDENHTASRSKLINSVEYVRFDECINLMEAYHKQEMQNQKVISLSSKEFEELVNERLKHRVNLISDEDIKTEAKDKHGNNKYLTDKENGFRGGAKWFKNKLLEQ